MVVVRYVIQLFSLVWDKSQIPAGCVGGATDPAAFGCPEAMGRGLTDIRIDFGMNSPVGGSLREIINRLAGRVR